MDSADTALAGATVVFDCEGGAESVEGSKPLEFSRSARGLVVGSVRWSHFRFAVTHPNQHAGGIVFPAALVGGIDQGVAGSLERRQLQQDAADFGVIQMA